jgi:hypothetical protein
VIRVRVRAIVGGLMCCFVPVVRVAVKVPSQFEFNIGGELFERIVQCDHFSQRDVFAVLRYILSFFGL